MKAMNGLLGQRFGHTKHRSIGHPAFAVPAFAVPAFGTLRLKSLRRRRIGLDCLRFVLLEARAQIRFGGQIARRLWRPSHLPQPCGMKPPPHDGFPASFGFLSVSKPEKNSCLLLRHAVACSQIPIATLHRFSARRFDEENWAGHSPSVSPVIQGWVSQKAAATNQWVVEPTCRKTLSGPRGCRQ